MVRFTPITNREQVGGEALAAFDSIVDSRNRINGPHSIMMYAPEVARTSTALSDALRFGGNLSDHDTELAIIVAARHWDCDYVWASHSQAALKAGVRPEVVEIIANDGNINALTREEAIIVRYGRELMDGHKVSEEAFDMALAQFGEANTVVLGALMGYYSFISCTQLASDMAPPEGASVLPRRTEAL